MKLKKFWSAGGGGARRERPHPLDPPLQIAQRVSRKKKVWRFRGERQYKFIFGSVNNFIGICNGLGFRQCE